ncbi:uncharacterized protein NPIL_245171 [Nephila pilipes]|nr:uncharacterized protein NPIL_49541 [Nephila pilipes]GFU02713.1 uncharacterized protein NPIL_245171 [Nephila pilipes]
MPSLMHMCLTKVARIVYTDPVVWNVEAEFNTPLYCLPHEKWESTIKQFLTTHYVAIGTIQRQIISLMKPTSYQISKWRNDHVDILGSSVFKPIKFRWKNVGTIDRYETARVLVKCTNFNISQRFVLACNYWIEEAVHDLWKEMPRFERDAILEETEGELPCIRIARLWVQWSRRGFRFEDPEGFVHDLLPECFDDAHLVCSILPKLPYEHALELFIDTMKNEPNKQDLRACLSKLNENQIEEVFEMEPFYALRIVLDWPLQDQFMERLDWDDLAESNFLGLLHVIICQKIVPEWRDYDYVGLLREFWEASPQDYKEYVEEDEFYPLVIKIITEGCPKPVPKEYLWHAPLNFHRNSKLCLKDMDCYD